MLEAAREYRRLGLHPIPCEPRGKRPLVEWKIYQRDPPHPDEIEAWWTKTPDANVGLVLGRGMFAVDADGGVEALKLLRAEGIELPACPVSRTGKGLHVFLSAPGPVSDRVALLKNGGTAQVDIRGVGIVVAPPSIHPSGKRYEWERPLTLPLPDAPPALLDLIQRGRSRGTDGTADSSWVAEALRGVPQGSRDDTCAKLAGHYLNAGLRPADVETLLLESFARHCTPPFTPADVRKTVQSIARKDASEQQEAERAAMLPLAEVIREGDDFRLAWPTLKVQVDLSRLRDAGDGVQSEIAIALDARPLHWSRLNLASLSAREGLVTKLNRTRAKVPWREVIEEACRETARRFREGAPTVELAPRMGVVERRLVDKLLLDLDINVLFSDGGSGKSLLALALAVAVRTEAPLPGGLIPRRHGPVLYLDWESCREEHEERFAGLLAGLSIPGPVPIAYRKMVGALADEAPILRAEVARLGAVLVVVDSLVPACGPEPETADATIRAFAALRSFGVASLVLAHVNKTMADARGAARPFGSVYVQNLPRNVWEIRHAEEEEENTLTIGLYHRKTNRGRLLPPFGLQFVFEKDATHIHSADLAQDEGLRERAGLGYSILAALRSGSLTIADLVEETQGTESGVKKALYRLEKAGKVVRVGEAGHGPGRPVTWGLTV